MTKSDKYGVVPSTLLLCLPSLRPCNQRYVWWKKSLDVWTKDHPFPIDIDYMISDTLELLRPKIKLCNSLEESIRHVQELEREFLIKLGKNAILKNKGAELLVNAVFAGCPVFSVTKLSQSKWV